MSQDEIKTLLTIRDADVYQKTKERRTDIQYHQRQAARAVVFDQNHHVAILFVSKHGYYKLPGRGVDSGETVIEALHRECREEIGCAIEVGKSIGKIIEYRDQEETRKENFCFVAMVVGEKGEPKFMEDEIEDGLQVLWVPFEKAKELIQHSSPKTYDGPFIIKRDLVFLEQMHI